MSIDLTTKDIGDLVDINGFTFEVVVCPICGKLTLDAYWICENCGWEYDETLDEHTYSSANNSTITEYREKVGY